MQTIIKDISEAIVVSKEILEKQEKNKQLVKE